MQALYTRWHRRLRAVCGCMLLAACAANAAPLQLALTPARAQQAIKQAVAQLPPQREEHRRYRMALSFGSPLFPPDSDLATPPVSAALAAWLSRPASQRQHDVLITPDIDYYWNAEGRQYSCQFLLHIEARGTGAQLTVLQLQSTEYAGKHFQLLGRTGPGRYVTLLPAAPSAQSEAELRAFLATALAGQQ